MQKTDYLIIGSGAVGMAFADTILTETDAHIIIVDRYEKPGGHWNFAYPFVTLHQPSEFYGVSSVELSKDRKDTRGLNKGLNGLATGAEVKAYYEEVMQHHFLPTGRVQYFPLCDYQGDGKFVSLITGAAYEVEVNKKTVDATYLKTSIPATHTPNFEIDPKAAFIPINDLPKIAKPPEGFVVIGGGKTGIDACLWLLEHKVDPDKIRWIIPRDAWMLDRKNTQPSMEFFEHSMGAQVAQFEAVVEATSITDLFDRLEEKGALVRLDRKVRPKMFHGATVSQLELAQLQRIKNVIRMGRVQKITPDEIILEEGTISTSLNHLHIDCSARAIANLEIKPIFEGDTITPQTVRSFQPVFSAAFIAHVEATYEGEETKNDLCKVVPLPNHDTDWLKMLHVFMMNQYTWKQDKDLRQWLLDNRLDGMSQLLANVPKEDEAKQAIIQRLRASVKIAVMKIHGLVSEIPTAVPSFIPAAVPSLKLGTTAFQVHKKQFSKGEVIKTKPLDEMTMNEGEIIVKIDRFAYTSNNITYALVGDRIRYWQFFPAQGKDKEDWGVIPVWGFADVVQSNVADIPVGDRLFGYFSPATYLIMKPVGIADHRFIDGMEHRTELPSGYNIYRRVKAEPNYTKAMDNARMLLFPLHLTSFCLWDLLKDKSWYGAKQVIILSASSKTSIGLAYALNIDEAAPTVLGMTSAGNLKMVRDLGFYDQAMTYENVETIDATIPTVIVDMSGNQKVLRLLYAHLGENMNYCINVGLTHWEQAGGKDKVLAQKSEFFFAPGHIQKRLKEWGPAEFDQKSSAFLKSSMIKAKDWLTFEVIDGLEGLLEVHPQVCDGLIAPNKGLIVEI